MCNSQNINKDCSNCEYKDASLYVCMNLCGDDNNLVKEAKHICGNCKYWGDEKLVYEGKELDHIRRCMKVTQEGIKVFTIYDSPCDEEDINGWEVKDGYSVS